MEILRGLAAEGHEVAVFGEIAREVRALGFRAVVVCVDSRFLPDDFAGREYNDRFLADLPPGVDACGENGGFHTFVHDGPGFASPVPFTVLGREEYVAPPELGGTRYCFAKLG